MGQIKALAFDLGNVLFNFDYNIALTKIKDRADIPTNEIFKALHHTDFTLRFEKGLISGREFYQEFKDKFISSLTYNEFVDIWVDIFSLNREVIELATELKKQYPLYLISNINKLHFDYLCSQYPEVFSLFKSLILSYEVNSVKPETKIYKCLKDSTGVGFENIAYIDDRQDLIEQARKLNLNCIQFIEHNKLVKDLAALDVVAF